MTEPEAYNKTPIECPFNKEVTCHMAICLHNECRFYIDPIYITKWEDLEGETVARVVASDGEFSVYITMVNGKRVAWCREELVGGDGLFNWELVTAGWMSEEEHQRILAEEQAKYEAERQVREEVRDRAKYEELKKRFGDD